MNHKIEESIERVYHNLVSNIDELRRELKTYESGDIAKILLEIWGKNE